MLQKSEGKVAYLIHKGFFKRCPHFFVEFYPSKGDSQFKRNGVVQSE